MNKCYLPQFVGVFLAVFVLLGITFEAQAQNRISGRVIDINNGEAIIGANIIEKGTTNGAVTDLNGYYELVVSPESRLIFSFVGYTAIEETVGNRMVIDIALKEDIETLEELVVVGYGIQRKSDLTGSIASVKANELTKTATPNINQALQGKVAGVQVTAQSGSPGAGMNINIRGLGTVNGGGPLFVIDGLPVTGDASFLNPNDIESLEVLKDASATAIYGSRGANGVVLITTKSGKKGKSTVNYNTYVGVQSVWNTLELTSASEWALLKNEARRADGSVVLPGLEDPAALGEGTDWQNEVFRSAMMMNHQLSFSGANERSSYYISGDYIGQDGVMDGTDFRRLSLRTNATHQVKDWLKIGLNMNVANSKRNMVLENDEFDGNAPLNGAITLDPATPVYREDGSFGSSTFSNIRNPRATIFYNNNTVSANDLVGNIFGEITLAKGLVARSSAGLTYNNGTHEVFNPKFFVANYHQNQSNNLSLNNFENFSYTWTNTLNYMFDLNEKHQFNVLVGQEVQFVQNKSMMGFISGIPDKYAKHPTLENGDPTTAKANSWERRYGLVSYLSRLNYNFDNRYLLTATMRADGSSRFGSKKPWGYFPSFAFGWNLHNEHFMSLPTQVSMLKVRAGWGQNGNQDTSDEYYPYLTQVSTLPAYSFGQGDGMMKNPGAAPIGIGNSEIKWETTTTLNIGLDLGLFDDRLNVSGEYFTRETSDMLVQLPIPDHVGIEAAPFVNAGAVRNAGFEFSVQWRAQKEDFSYSLGANVTTIKNEVTSLGEGGEPILSGSFRGIGYISRTAIGHPIGAFYGHKMVGIFQTQEEIDEWGAQQNAKPGDVKFAKDENGELIQDYIGSPHPDLYLNFNASFRYKQFDLSMNFQGTVGNDIYNGIRYYTEGTGFGNYSRNMLNRWTGPGTSNDVPRVTENGAQQNLYISDRFVEDGSYLRLQNLQFGYTLPSNLVNRAGLENVRIYLSGQNLFTLTNYSGLDPEIGSRSTNRSDALDIGIDRGVYPQARIFMVGANISF